jgi:SpoVK/Ycf46/Vps4 family AAA+-type ATPase
MINAIRDSRERQLWVLRDVSQWTRDPLVNRGLRSLARILPTAPRDASRAIIMLSPTNDLPPELAAHAIVIEFPLPDRAEIAALFDAAIAALPEDIRVTAAPNGTRDRAIDSAIGLTAEEATSCFAKSLVTTRTIDPAAVASEKKRVISREKVLEWVDPIAGGLDAVGGLENLKAWLVERRAAFTPKAREYGLPAPKGCLLVGVPGCGKSLTAKAIATAWQMPLLRLDLGALKGKFVGESEGNMRKALKTAETIAPCVLWVDEIEKGMAGATNGGAADGGVSMDQMGALLSWLQDRAGSVFMVATANDVSALPPELMRKGRFDQLFAIDLPTAHERVAILKTALKAHGRGAVAIDHAAVAHACNTFTGSEIAALVPDALFVGFNDGAREITTADLINAARKTVPLSRTAAAKIEAIRQWGKANAVPASISTETAGAAVRTLDL